VDRFWLRGRWLVGNIVVLLIAVLFVRLAFWQLSRLREVREANARVEAQETQPVVPLEAALEPDATEPGDALYRRVEAVGRYDPAHQVEVRFRDVDERTGEFVLTPLVLSDGSAILVNRGFVPLAGSGEGVPPQGAPPAGEVTATGLLLAGERPGTIIERDPSTGSATVMSAIDLAAVQEQVSYDLYPAWLALTSQDPAQSSGVPEMLPSPELDEGPHLSYAIQWFLFTVIGLIGWPLLIRRSARDRARKAALPAPID
jgi:cytochrome oxidase assembly protein ShyY1